MTFLEIEGHMQKLTDWGKRKQYFKSHKMIMQFHIVTIIYTLELTSE